MIVSILHCQLHGRQGVIAFSAADGPGLYAWRIQMDGESAEYGVGRQLSPRLCPHCDGNLCIWAHT